MKKVAFHTLGCKLNYSETSTIARQLTNEGFKRVDFSQSADLYIINTCSVTENADKECKYIIRKAKKNNSNAIIAVTGCYAQLQPEEISKIDGVDLVLGASEKFNIIKHLNKLDEQSSKIYACDVQEANFFVDSYSLNDRTRSFLKVQDGCDYNCSYCTIPLARGISRSDTVPNIVTNANKIAKEGVKEIVLTGVNIGDFGKGETGNKKHEHTFLELLRELDDVSGISRFRISSIEPNLLSNEIIDFVSKSDKFVPHFHIPLQSGSNQILKKMRRRYLKEAYSDRVTKIKETMPNCCIGADVIVGFPGESDNHFLETYNYLNQLDISYLHVFTFSERANTLAFNMKDSVPKKTRSKRSKMLRILSNKKLNAFYQTQLNNIKNVLFEHKNKNGFMYGYTSNYIRVKVPYSNKLQNSIAPTMLTEITENNTVLGNTLVKKLAI